jgi:uncharacterized protein (DUF697 family)
MAFLFVGNNKKSVGLCRVRATTARSSYDFYVRMRVRMETGDGLAIGQSDLSNKGQGIIFLFSYGTATNRHQPNWHTILVGFTMAVTSGLSATMNYCRSAAWRNQVKGLFYNCSRIKTINSNRFRIASSCRFFSNDSNTNKAQQQDNSAANYQKTKLIYKSPFGFMVTRLRAASIVTGLLGGIGMPLQLYMKTDVPMELLAGGVSFTFMTVVSTIFIHALFHPYVESIQQVQVAPASETKSVVTDISQSTATSPVLYTATTRSPLLRRKEHVFAIDTVTPYSGLHPMANLFVNNKTPLYVHVDALAHEELRTAMALDKPAYAPTKHNPDDELF